MEYYIKLSNKMKLIVALFLMGIFLTNPIESKAEETETIIIKNLTEADAWKVLQSVNIRACDIDVLKRLPIIELLVSDRWVAVGAQDVIEGKSENAVGVFDIKGNLKYAITFNTTGTHKLYYDNETDSLVINISRASTYYTFDSNGILTSMEGYDSKKGLKKEDNRFRDCEGNEYFLSGGIGIGKFFATDMTTVIRKNTEGVQEVFFQTDYSRFGFLIKCLPTLLIIIIVSILEYKFHIFSREN